MMKRMGTDGIERDLDEHYDHMSDVRDDPTGACDAIQVLWLERMRLLAVLEEVRSDSKKFGYGQLKVLPDGSYERIDPADFYKPVRHHACGAPISDVKYTDPRQVARKLQILKSDLKDCRNPKMLSKYPHLGSPENVAQCEKALAEFEDKISKEDSP
jgi:hypothetical protein|tara:strand:- start:26 stop:496 length:471 start_codon:yes stop_codon:yes gene_type:complete